MSLTTLEKKIVQFFAKINSCLEANIYQHSSGRVGTLFGQVSNLRPHGYRICAYIGLGMHFLGIICIPI